VTEKELEKLAETTLVNVNPNDIQITKEGDGIYIEVDDTTETYQALVSFGKALNVDASEYEAFELALTTIISSGT
jgi:hypothetical protein